MAKIVKQTIGIEVSKLVKDSDSDKVDIISPEDIETLQEVLEKIFGNKNIIAEITSID